MIGVLVLVVAHGDCDCPQTGGDGVFSAQGDSVLVGEEEGDAFVDDSGNDFEYQVGHGSLEHLGAVGHSGVVGSGRLGQVLGRLFLGGI